MVDVCGSMVFVLVVAFLVVYMCLLREVALLVALFEIKMILREKNNLHRKSSKIQILFCGSC